MSTLRRAMVRLIPGLLAVGCAQGGNAPPNVAPELKLHPLSAPGERVTVAKSAPVSDTGKATQPGCFNASSSLTPDGHQIFGGGGCFHPLAQAATGPERSLHFWARPLDGAGWGVSLGGTEDERGFRGLTLIYTAGMRRLFLVQYPEGKPRLSGQSPIEVADGWHEFRVVRTRELFLVWLDGKLLVTFADSEYQGGVGFWTRGGHVEVRDVLLDTPTNNDLVAFSGLPLGWAGVTPPPAPPEAQASEAADTSRHADGAEDGESQICAGDMGGPVHERKDFGFVLPEQFGALSRKAEFAVDCARGFEIWGAYKRAGSSETVALMSFSYQPAAKLTLTKTTQVWHGFKILLEPNLLVGLLSSRSTLAVTGGELDLEGLKAFFDAASPKTLERTVRAKLAK